MSIDTVKEAIKQTPISTIIGNYLTVASKGRDKVCLCPFHSDTRPSLRIQDNKGLFWCFVCDYGGDSISFVQRYLGVDFIGALRELAKLLGIDEAELEEEEKSPKIKLAKKMVKELARIYHQKGRGGGFPAYQNFCKQRKLGPSICSQFQIGLAPKGNVVAHYIDSLRQDERKLAREVALEVGVLSRGLVNRKGAQYFDTFRDRIVFPISNDYGTVVGFGTRAIHDYQKAKYVNSPESFLFHKKNILYGLNESRTFIQKEQQVILVEGYMDYLALYQAGVKNVVAIMGVGLSASSISRLAKLTKNFVLALDSDAAGKVATQRIHRQLMEMGQLTRLLDFSPCKDADELIHSAGVETFKKRLNAAPLLVDVNIEGLLSTYKSEAAKAEDGDGEGEKLVLKVAVLEKVFEQLAPLKESLLATEKIIQVAADLELKSDPQQLLKEYRQYLEGLSRPKAQKSNQQRPVKRNQVEAQRPDQVAKRIAERASVMTRTEKFWIHSLVRDPGLIELEKFEHILGKLKNKRVKEFCHLLKETYFEVGSEYLGSFLLDMTGAEEKWKEIHPVVAGALFAEKIVAQGAQEKKLLDQERLKIVEDVFAHLLRDEWERKRRGLLESLKNSPVDDKIKLLEEMRKIQNQINQLRK